MEILLLVVAVLVVPLLVVAAVTLLGGAAGRLYAAVMGPRRRRREGRSAPDIWTDVVEARRDGDALRARPDIDQSWTAWGRRDGKP